MPNRNTTTPTQVVAQRILEARKRRGWTQDQLAARLTEVGHPVDRAVVAKIETGARQSVTVTELFAFAVALDVPPVHLLAPLDDDAVVAVTSKIIPPARVVRTWVRGLQPLWSKQSGPGDWRAFLLAFPESELQETMEKVAYARAKLVDRMAAEFLDVNPKAARQVQERAEDYFAETQRTRKAKAKEGNDG